MDVRHKMVAYTNMIVLQSAINEATFEVLVIALTVTIKRSQVQVVLFVDKNLAFPVTP